MRAARGRRRPQAAAENRALHKLAECANGEPRDVLQGLLSLAAELVGGGEATSTAGVSLLETGADGEEQFRWVALVGRLGAHMGEATPRDYSPCGECLNHGEPIVLARPDLKYTYFLASGTEFTEGLIVPFGTSADAAPIGTIWVVSHPPERRCFDDEDVRMMVSLGSFASSAYHMAEGREIAQRASRAQLSPGDVDARRSADVADRLAQAIDGAADGREPPPDDADVAAVDSGDAGDQGVWRSTAA
ncbi:MAG TPA: GAF domain-containing protein, partial [Gemmatimonadaceae bacterium]